MEVLQTSALPLGYVAAVLIFNHTNILYRNLPLVNYFFSDVYPIEETQKLKLVIEGNIQHHSIELSTVKLCFSITVRAQSISLQLPFQLGVYPPTCSPTVF